MDTIIGIIEDSTAGQEQHWQELRAAQSRILENRDEKQVTNLQPPRKEIDSALVPSDRRSEVNRSMHITAKRWIVSLARNPDSSTSEHAFIIIEGIQNSAAVIWFIDFVTEGFVLRNQVGIKPGKIRLEKPEPVPMSHYLAMPYESRLIFAGKRNMFNLNHTAHLLSSSWQISSGETLAFIKSIEKKIRDNNFPKFTIVGHDSALGQISGATQSEEAGHNCFTWAKSVLLDLKEVKASGILSYSSLQDWIGCTTSNFLRDNRPLAKVNQLYRNFAIGAIFVAILATAFALTKTK